MRLNFIAISDCHLECRNFWIISGMPRLTDGPKVCTTILLAKHIATIKGKDKIKMNQSESSSRLLAAFAHPDDEAFGTGGTLARYAATGGQVALICATMGEVGEISDSSLATPETLPQVRAEELRCAAQILGVSELVFLGYRDSGMAGTPANNDPRAFANVSETEVVGRLVGLIRRWRPQVVVTFDPEGGYGHPDHIAIHRHTVTAFHAAADPARYPSQDPSWQPARLFYTVIPRSLFRTMHRQLEAMGRDDGPFAEADLDNIGWPDDEIHLSLDVSESMEAKWAALTCHKTQFGPQNPFRQLPREQARELMSREHFILAWPEPEAGVHLADLFDGLEESL
jgi:N-acetyl-1-D-myo-inositol-2-amino-2-deoxy-alpha-D-glucopyranoside deacetylase